MTDGDPPPFTSPRSRVGPGIPALTAAVWNRRRQADRLHGLPRWPRWLRALPETKRPDVLMHLFAALLLLVPGGVLVVSTHLPAQPAMTATVLFFVIVHAALHLLSVWRSTAPAPFPRTVRTIDAHAPWLMLASACVPAVLQGLQAGAISALGSTALGLGALCQAGSVRVTADRLGPALRMLGSVLQLIAIAWLRATVSS